MTSCERYLSDSITMPAATASMMDKFVNALAMIQGRAVPVQRYTVFLE